MLRQNAGVSIPTNIYSWHGSVLALHAVATITTTLTGIDAAINGTTLILTSTDANLQTWSWVRDKHASGKVHAEELTHTHEEEGASAPFL